MSIDLSLLFSLLSVLAALVALATVLLALSSKWKQTPVRIRVRSWSVARPFPPQTDDIFPALSGFATHRIPRGPPVFQPPLPGDDPPREQA